MNENRTAFEVSVELSLHGIEERIDKLERMTTGGPTLSPKEPEKVWPQYANHVYHVNCNRVTSFNFIPNKIEHAWALSTGNVHHTEAEAGAYKAWLTSPEAKAHREEYMANALTGES